MTEKNPKLGPELYSLDKDGKKADAHLHDEMLSGSAKDEFERLKLARAGAKSRGLSQEHINILYRQRKS